MLSQLLQSQRSPCMWMNMDAFFDLLQFAMTARMLWRLRCRRFDDTRWYVGRFFASHINSIHIIRVIWLISLGSFRLWRCLIQKDHFSLWLLVLLFVDSSKWVQEKSMPLILIIVANKVYVVGMYWPYLLCVNIFVISKLRHLKLLPQMW